MLRSFFVPSTATIMLVLTLAHASFAQAQTRIEYLGAVDDAGHYLRAPPRVDGNMLANPRVAFIILERHGNDTSARLRYRGGERALRFVGQVSEFRVLAEAGREFTVTASASGAQCYSEIIRIERPGVWRLRLPC